MSEQAILGSGSARQGELRFGGYRLAGPHGPLRAAGVVIELPRKPLALLWALASRPGEVVTKDELLATVWPCRVVTEGVIAASLRELRRALGDDARRPRFIATAHRIGYRFIARIDGEASLPGPEAHRDAPAAPAHDSIVGREVEQALLHKAMAQALEGRRQLVFVTGEAGIGKSRLVESFVSSLAAFGEGAVDGAPADVASPQVGHGQCIEHYGAGEPYLPILEAVTRLCRRPGGDVLLPLLRQHAPTWLSQLPSLAGQADQAALQHGPGTDPIQRMLREMAEAIDAAAADQLLVLVFEDLHWSDSSTVDWLAKLARRRERARLLVLATCRPIELIVNQHPLKRVKQELLARSEAVEIPLGGLAPRDVATYVEQQMEGAPMGAEVGIHHCHF